MGRPAPFDDPQWIFELKYDGFRALAIVEHGRAQLLSRNGHPFASFSALAESISDSLPNARAVIDGEICSLDKRGRPQFKNLLFHRGNPPCFFAFDLLTVIHLHRQLFIYTGNPKVPGQLLLCAKKAPILKRLIAEKEVTMRLRLLLLTSLLSLGTAIATAQNPLAGVTKLQADGIGTGGSSVASGTLRGDPMGSASWTYVNESSGLNTTNGQGGNCATTAGHITINAADGSTINMRHAGTSCNTDGTVGGAVNVVGYVITSGTGRYANTAGTGNVVEGAVNGAGGVTYIHFDGNIDLH